MNTQIIKSVESIKSDCFTARIVEFFKKMKFSYSNLEMHSLIEFIRINLNSIDKSICTSPRVKIIGSCSINSFYLTIEDGKVKFYFNFFTFGEYYNRYLNIHKEIRGFCFDLPDE